MKIWAEIDVVEAFDQSEQERILDACLGRIVYCDYLFDHTCSDYETTKEKLV